MRHEQRRSGEIRAPRPRGHPTHGIGRLRGSGPARFAPSVGGGARLGLRGSGGEGTDVIAPLTGFFSGLLLGAVYGTLANRLRLNARMQLAFGSLAIGLLAFAWLSALRAQLQ